jgi:hypothetical protein
MDQIAINWTIFGWSLAGAFVFGIVFASVVRWASKKHWVGQTAWAVVVGVGATLAAMVPVFGINLVAMILCYFVATGLPMIVEYLLRIQEEIKQDQDKANGLAKDLLK